MPRRNRQPRARPTPGDPPRPVAGGLGWAQVVTDAGGRWNVRSVPGSGAVKPYRCPGCDHEITVGTSHLVVWSADPDERDSAEQRRHWHSPCWSARHRRRPGGRR